MSKITSVILLLLFTFNSHAGLSRKVVGNIAWWDQAAGYQVVKNNTSIFSEVTPTWFRLDVNGNIIPEVDYYGKSMVDLNMISFMKSNGILISPSITNTVNYQWDSNIISSIINNAMLRSQHINSIVSIVQQYNLDGITLDYESLYASDRNAYSNFVRELSYALKSINKKLNLDVHPKTAEPGTWDGPQSQDWSVLGQYADQIRIMVYDYHWSTSVAGPLSPIGWATQVLDFAVTQIPKSKIIQGMPLYGYDWGNAVAAEALTWQTAVSRASAHGATINWDSLAQTNWYQYTISGVTHTVYFENERSVIPKLQITNQHDISGVGLWRLGGEDPDVYRGIASAFGVTNQDPEIEPQPKIDEEAPIVSVDRVASRFIDIKVSSSDNIGVVSLDIYLNNKLIKSGTVANVSFRLSNKKLNAGENKIVAVAKDAAGNVGSAQLLVYK